MKRGSFAAGFLTCLLLAGIPTTAYAAGIMAERSHHRIVVDGKEAQMEAYVINGNNYVQLRDIGKAVGFEVYWDSDNGCVQVESGKPYTGTAPQQTAAAPTDGSRYVPKVGDVIRCDDGTNYTIKDVSRWDKNAFSSAPLGELPIATCDWSKLPQPEMPQAEVVEIVGQVNQIVEVIHFIATAIHDCHEMLKLRAGHLIQPRGKVVELIEVFIFAKKIADSMNGAVIIRDKPFLIDLTELVL